ncbi:MAG: arsenate reductase ArsC, partial [Aquificaceae bacterium]|nr:arsenate reductase ArsC [Aquificaceae bacterium]
RQMCIRDSPLAVMVMREKGVDISTHKPKGLEAIPYKEMDLIITLCDHASQTCPEVPGVRKEHWNLQDPASFVGSEAEKIEFFRRVRDDIEERVWDLLQSLQLKQGTSTRP